MIDEKPDQSPLAIEADLTPKILLCPPIGACPRVLRTNKSTFIIVGRRLADLSDLPEVAAHVSAGEAAIEVPVELLLNLT